MTWLGIDLGTSSVKVVAVDGAGNVLAVGSRAHSTTSPEHGAAEQDPDEWWSAVGTAVRSLKPEIRDSIQAIGLSGQMHGTVCLDENHYPVRPAVIWSDVRGAATAARMTAQFGKPRLAELVGTSLAAGFQAVTLAWMRDAHPDEFAQTRVVLLPKDYLRMRLTGVLATEPSDAAGTGMFGVAGRNWSPEVMDAVGISESRLPPVGRSASVTGALTAEAQAHLGIDRPLPVCGGGADASLAALGSGVTEPGQLMVTLSSGAQVTSFIDRANVDPELRTHTFASPFDPDRGECGWYVMGATLSAGTSLNWLRDNVIGMAGASFENLMALAGNIEPGANGLIFVPYIAGERTPYMDALARGAFIGLTSEHDRSHIVRSVLEGTVFALHDAFDLVVAQTAKPTEIVVAGGGARSALWVQIVADMLDSPVRPNLVVDQSAVGAAALAAAAISGERASDIGRRWARLGPVVEPNPWSVARYASFRPVFTRYYSAFAEHFSMLGSHPT